MLIWARRAYIGNTLRSKNGLHAFGNNSAGSEPIRMKSGPVIFAKCGGGVALADFGRDPRSNDSLRGIFFLKNAKLHTKFPGVATLGCHNSAMITDRRKLTSKWFLC